MILLIYKILAALLIFLLSAAALLYPLKKRTSLLQSRLMQFGEAFASGIFLGAAFFHLLPDASKQLAELGLTTHLPIADIICVSGFLLLLLLEQMTLQFSLPDAKHAIPYLLTLTLMVHALIEGAALGIRATLTETVIIFVAILVHKGSESFALCIALVRHELAIKKVVILLLLFSLMTPIGIGMGVLINQFIMADNGKLLAACFNAFAAGTFLYISILNHQHMHPHAKESRGMIKLIYLVMGVILMGTIAIWI